MGISEDITERKEAEAKLLAYQEQLRALTSELILVEERERRRIASELHDQIGQNLALCKLKVAALEKSRGAGCLKEELSAVRRLLECSIQDARSLIFDLSPPVLYELGFAGRAGMAGRKDRRSSSTSRSNSKTASGTPNWRTTSR